MSNLHNVFVYGTLKRDQPNNDFIESQENGYSKFICNAISTQRYPLVIATRYNIPFLLHHPGVGHFVKGMVYEVDDQKFVELDRFEKHPVNYQRDKDEFRPLENPDLPETIECDVYFLKDFKEDLLTLPMYESYDSNGPHNLKYVDKVNREIGWEMLTEIR